MKGDQLTRELRQSSMRPPRATPRRQRHRRCRSDRDGNGVLESNGENTPGGRHRGPRRPRGVEGDVGGNRWEIVVYVYPGRGGGVNINEPSLISTFNVRRGYKIFNPRQRLEVFYAGISRRLATSKSTVRSPVEGRTSGSFLAPPPHFAPSGFLSLVLRPVTRFSDAFAY